jgi:hypothetical protein
MRDNLQVIIIVVGQGSLLSNGELSLGLKKKTEQARK